MAKGGAVKAVAFDLDGLMFNTEEIYIDVAREMLETRGHELDMQVIRQMMGRPATTGLPIMIAHYGLRDDVATLEAETERIFRRLLPTALAPLPGLCELLERLDAAGIPKAIATSSRRRYVERILELAQLPTDWKFLLTAEDVEHGKPHPEIYQIAAERFGVEPEAMMVLEDSEHGCQAASRAGALTIVCPGAHNANANYPLADMCVASLDDPRIVRWIPKPGASGIS